MRKLLTIVAAMITCNAYGEKVAWLTATDGTIYSTTSCNSGTNIIKPADPTKYRYRFMGWREATEAEKKPVVITKITDAPTSYSPTGSGGQTSWTATYSWGTITGSSLCSSTSGSNNCHSNSNGSCTKNSSPSTSGTIRYCWCKVTNVGTELKYFVNLSSLQWVFNLDYSEQTRCTNGCAFQCGSMFKSQLKRRKTQLNVE